MQQSNYDLQLNLIWNDSSIYRDLATMYTNQNWFVILLSSVYFSDWVTEIRHFSPLKTNNSAQLRTLPVRSNNVFIGLRPELKFFLHVLLSLATIWKLKNHLSRCNWHKWVLKNLNMFLVFLYLLFSYRIGREFHIT